MARHMREQRIIRYHGQPPRWTKHDCLDGASIVAGASQVFGNSMLSGIVGVLHNKYLPTGDMNAVDLWLELTLANAEGGILADAARILTVDSVELVLEYIDEASDAARVVYQSNSGGWMISFDSFANYSSSSKSGAGPMNVLIPAFFIII